MHGHLVLDYLSASGKAKSKTLAHIHRVIPKSLPVLCNMATADNSDIMVNDPSDNLAGCRLSQVVNSRYLQK